MVILNKFYDYTSCNPDERSILLWRDLQTLASYVKTRNEDADSLNLLEIIIAEVEA